MEFWRIYRIIRRRRWLILLGTLVCLGVVAFNILFMSKPMYTGRTTLMESTGMTNEGPSLYPQQMIQLDIQLKLSNLGAIAESQSVMEGAAKQLEDLGMRETPDEILTATTVEPVKDTNILEVAVTLPRAEDAKVAADVVANEFKRRYNELSNGAVQQSVDFIQVQLNAARKSMVKAEDALKQYKEDNEITQIDQQSMAQVQRLAEAKSEMERAQTEYQNRVARMQKLTAELNKLKPHEWELVSTTTQRDPVWQQLQQQLVQLETQKQGMINGAPGQQRRGKNHPEVVSLQQQIDDINQKLKDKYKNQNYLAGKSEARNPVYENAMNMAVSAKVDEVGGKALWDGAVNEVEAIRDDMKSLPEQQAKVEELVTDVKASTDTYGLLKSKLEEAKIKEKQAGTEDALKTVDPAYVVPVNQKWLMKLLLALVMGPMLGIGTVLLLHYTDNTVRTAADAENLLGVPVLAAIPATRAHALATQRCPEIVNIAYQTLSSSLWVASQNQEFNAVALVSAEPDTGRSVIASNLAITLAKEGARVVLVDADMRKPAQHLIFGLDNKVGLSNLLSGAASVEDVLVPTRVQRLLVIPSGPTADNPAKLVRSQEMKDFADQVKELADFVIYDTPAGVTFPDSVLIASQVGNAILVHSAGRIARGSEIEMNSRLTSVDVALLGAVLNNVKREDSSGYFHYRRSYQEVVPARLPKGKRIANV